MKSTFYLRVANCRRGSLYLGDAVKVSQADKTVRFQLFYLQTIISMTDIENPSHLLASALRRLLSLRACNIGGQVIAILAAVYYLEMSLPIEPLVIILASLIAWSVLTLFLFKQRNNITDNLFFLQLSVDVLALTAMLYFTGGATNPFAWFLLVPHSIASTLLSRRYVWLMALLTSLSYTLIVFFYTPLVHLGHQMEMGMNDHFQDHVIGMWIGFVLSTVLMAHFVGGMAESLRKRNAQVLRLREQMFRDERLVALGTLATSAAHELGTPLGTMDVLTHELALVLEQASDTSVGKKLIMIQGQIKRCKAVLLSITKTAVDYKYDSGQLMTAEEYLDTVIMQWKISNLDVGFNFRIKGKSPLPNVISDTGLTRALVNVLDNAAQASPHFVCLELDWNADNLSIVISDEGDGMAAEQLDKLGKHPMTSKEEGLGIGLYLTKATIEKLGGSIEWQNRQLNGVEVSIKLPLALKGI